MFEFALKSRSTITKLMCLLAVLMFFALSASLLSIASAATGNPSTASPGYQIVPVYIPGPLTATATPVKFKAPWPYRVVGVSAYARTIKTSATDETYTLDVQQGSTSVLSSPISIAASNTVYEGTLATAPNITDEATVSIIATIGGTSPTVSDITVLLVLKRL
jgi:hypothetical protein